MIDVDERMVKKKIYYFEFQKKIWEKWTKKVDDDSNQISSSENFKIGPRIFRHPTATIVIGLIISPNPPARGPRVRGLLDRILRLIILSNII